MLAAGYSMGFSMRLGCNGRASPTALVNDDCGICGGNGESCLDCMGDKNGGKSDF